MSSSEEGRGGRGVEGTGGQVGEGTWNRAAEGTGAEAVTDGATVQGMWLHPPPTVLCPLPNSRIQLPRRPALSDWAD